MVRTRTGWLVALVALGLGAGACKKSEDKAGGGGASALLAGGDDLLLLPADSEVVLGLNFQQLQQSALWKQFSPALMAKAAAGLADFKAACGFDPMESLKSISMGMKGLGGAQPDGVVVIHGPAKSKVTDKACIEKVKAETAKNGGELVVDGDVFLMKDKRGASTALTYVNSDTLVASVGPAASKDTLLAATKGGSALKNSKMFVDLYSKINTKDSLWFLVNGNAPFMAKASQAGIAQPKAVFGSLNVTDGLSIDMRIRFANAQEVDGLVKMAQGQINNPQVKSMFDKLEVTADGNDAKFAVALSQQKLTQLMGLMGGMLGGMMGGGGGMGGGMGGP